MMTGMLSDTQHKNSWAVDHTKIKRKLWMQVTEVTQFWVSYPLKIMDFLHEGIAGEPNNLGRKVLAASS